MKAILTMRKPSAPMLVMLLAMYTSMPWMTDMTAMSVVVARIMPNRVRKLRSLLERKESAATDVASRNDAVWAIVGSLSGDEAGCHFVPGFAHPLYENLIQPKAGLGPGHETEVAAMFDGEQREVWIP